MISTSGLETKGWREHIGGLVSKPQVLKMAGAWIWRCHHSGGWTGNEYFVDRWPHPWAACHADAIRHCALYHPSGSEPAEEIEVP